jgi:hypothetical protein
MKSDKKQLREDILKAISGKPPGVIFSNLIIQVAGIEYEGKKFSKATVRREIERLGAEGWLTIRNSVLIYPTEKCRKHIEKLNQVTEEGDLSGC